MDKNNSDECNICYSSFYNLDTIILKNCGHYFCSECVKKLVLENPKCPIDRSDINTLSCINSAGLIIYTKSMKNFISYIFGEQIEEIILDVCENVINDSKLYISSLNKFQDPFKDIFESIKLSCNDFQLLHIKEMLSDFSKSLTQNNIYEHFKNNISIRLDKLENQILKHSIEDRKLIFFKINMIRTMLFCDLELNHLSKHIENYLKNIVISVGNGNKNDTSVILLMESILLRFNISKKYINIISSANCNISNSNSSVVSYHEVQYKYEIEKLIKKQLSGSLYLLTSFSKTTANLFANIKNLKTFDSDLLKSNIFLTNEIATMKYRFSKRTFQIHAMIITNDDINERLLNILIFISDIFQKIFTIIEFQISIFFNLLNDVINFNIFEHNVNQVNKLELLKLLCDNQDIPIEYLDQLDVIKSEIISIQRLMVLNDDSKFVNI